MKKFIMLFVMLIFIFKSNVLASPIGFLTKENNCYYEYNYEDLMNASLDNLLGCKSILYEDYIQKELVAFHDDKNGYINSDRVLQESMEYLIDGKKFDFCKFLSLSKNDNEIYEEKNITDVTQINGFLIRNKKVDLFDVDNIY